MTLAETPTWHEAIKPGVLSLDFASYRELPATNWHSLEPFRKSAKAGAYALARPSDASNVQAFGAAFHAAVLEPASFATDYATMPAFDGHPNSTAHKEAKRAWLAANADKVPLTMAERGELLAMQASVKAHPLASAMLYGKGRNEMTVVWDDAETGRRCKGRIDRLAKVKVGLLNAQASNATDDALAIIDVKTTRSAEPRKFTRDFADFAYHGQLAFYHDGLNAIKPAPYSVFVVAIENAPPFDVVVYQVGDDELEQGRRLYRRLLNTLISGEKSNYWPGVSDRVVPLYLPDWAKDGDL